MTHVVVVGGGVSGLTAAERITREAPGVDVTLVEGSPRLGGHMRTDRLNGFIMEAGPDVILAAKPAAIDLARRVGLGDRLVGTNPAVRGSYILSRGKLRRVPEGLTGLVPSQFTPFATTPLVSPAGKLRVAMDYFIPPSRAERDESIEEFVVRRLGREMYEQLVEPLLSGISAGDGARLSMQAMFPQLRDYERAHGGLVKGMLAARRRARQARAKTSEGGAASPTPALSAFVSFRAGLGELVDGLATALRERDGNGRWVTVLAGRRVQRVTRDADGGFTVAPDQDAPLRADAVVIATPAFVAADMLRSTDGELAELLSEIEYASTVTISLAYPMRDVPRPLDATGYIVPRIYGRPVLACTWASSKFTGRAPDDHALFRLFLGGATRGSYVDHSDDDLTTIARDEMRGVMGIDALPELVRINRFPRAMPQYNVGHLSRIAKIEAREASIPGLALAGAAYRGVGIPDCVRSGERAADAVLRHLGSLRTSALSGTSEP